MGGTATGTRVRRALGVTAALALVGTGCDLGRPLTTYGATPSGLLAVGDLNGDGHLDILSVATPATTLTGYTVLTGDGEGGFTPTVVDDGMTATSLDLADVEDDGDLDMVELISAKVAVRLNDGTGRFGESQYLPSATTDCRAGCYTPHDAAVGDLNGDGHADVVEAGDHPGYVWVRLADGSGGYGAAVFYRPRPWFIYQIAERVALADMDGDGDLDVVVAGQWTDNNGTTRGSIAVGRNDGSGQFVTFSAESLGFAPFGTLDLDLADVDGDGHLDVLNSNVGLIQTFYGDGAGGLPRSDYLTDQIGHRGSSWLLAHDLTGDGRVDLVVDTTSGATIRRAELFVADARGSFVYDRRLLADGRVNDAAAADLDADGRDDLVLASAQQAYVQVDLNGIGDG